MLMPRLIYGCARLTGGADARASRRLIEQVLAAGVRHFDAAPLYGLGTTEALLGEALAGRPEVRITTKAGLAPPAYGLLKSYARQAKALLRGRPPALTQDLPLPPTLARNPDADFSAAALERSFARSCERLRRDRVDVLLLHEAYREDAGGDAIAFLRAARDSGRADEVGYSTGAPFDAVTDAAFPPDLTAQVAMPVARLDGVEAPRDRLILHSLAKSWTYARRRDPVLARRLAAAVAAAGAVPTDPLSLELAVLFALAAARLPGARLIFASIDAGRLGSFLAAVAHLDRDVDPAALAAAFATG